MRCVPPRRLNCLLNRVCSAWHEAFWRAGMKICCSSVPGSLAGCPGEQGAGLGFPLPAVAGIHPAWLHPRQHSLGVFAIFSFG